MKSADKIITVTDEDYYYTCGYYSQNRWLDNDNLILSRCIRSSFNMNADKNNIKDVEHVKYTVSTGNIEVIEGYLGSSDYVVYNDLMYYIKIESRELWVYNDRTKEKRCVCKLERPMCSPHITNDGKYISLFGYANADKPEEQQIGVMGRVNTETGEFEEYLRKTFEKPFDIANHLMICPENPDMAFFAHEGTTQYISNRLWIYDKNLDKAWNLAKQNLDGDGNLGDCFGHEMWAPHGKGMYFVKYPVSPVPPKGICYVDIESGEHKVLYSKYRYWHVGVSKNNRFLLSDTTTGEKYSEVVVVDTEDNTETIIDAPEITWTHPCHPHPQMSPDCDKVCYTALSEENRTCVKIALLK